MEGDELVREYLGRLDAASWPLPADRRLELAGEVSEHIETALAEAGKHDVVTVRNVLERLGRPEEIVSSEADADPAPPASRQSPQAASAPARGWGAVEVAAVLLLTAGGLLLPLVGPAIGLVLVWLSRRWTTREKLIVTVIVGFVFLLPVLGLLAVGTGSGSSR